MALRAAEKPKRPRAKLVDDVTATTTLEQV